MNRKKWIVLGASLTLLGLVAWGTSAWIARNSGAHAAVCSDSTVAALALKSGLSPDVKKRIQNLDQGFVSEYTRICTQLCSSRGELAQRLATAKDDDPEARRLLETITGDQAQLEMLTWRHIVSLRDQLPEAQRAGFVQAVQAEWAEGMARMQHQVDHACPMHLDNVKGKTERR